MGKIVYGIISPHPPILIPKIGGKRINDIDSTKQALDKVSKKLKSLDPDTVIIITPHGEVSQTTIRVYGSHVFEGDFGQFGIPDAKLAAKGDSDLAHSILKEADNSKIYSAEIQESFLDHGIMVPLHYIQSAGFKKQILPIAISLIPLSGLYDFGKLLKKVVEASGKKVAIVASADMSHRLTQDAPSGYNPRGKVFDEKLVELVKANDVNGILNFDVDLAEEAGQDSLWSISILLGAFDNSNTKSNVLSYEGPFGVGYMVAEYEV